MDGYDDKPLILIADDIPSNIQVLAGILQDVDCHISVATNGKQVLQITKDVMPDLILLDVMMPIMDGFETCRILKEQDHTKHIPVIFLTAKVEIEDMVEGFNLGAVDYVTKPFNSTELLARVKTQLNLKKMQQDNIALEQKNSVLAMIVTANHELNQPLTGAIANFDYFRMSFDEDNMNEEQIKCISQLEKSLNEIKDILTKFRKADSFSFENYISDVKMVSFDTKKDHTKKLKE